MTLAATGEDGTAHPVRGLWAGHVAGVFHLLCACGGHLWDVDASAWTKTDLGEITDAETFLFGFAKKVYLLTGSEYYCWTGTGSVAAVEGYVPIVATATAPSGGGTLLESVNKLTGKRRQQFSPDGTATEFMLVETGTSPGRRIPPRERSPSPLRPPRGPTPSPSPGGRGTGTGAA